jgi:predicted ferric reductase
MDKARSKRRRGLPALLVALLYLAFLACPLALASLDAQKTPIWREIASGAGALGFAFVLAEFVLSGRFTLVSGRVGIDAIMRLHQLAGRAALVLIAFHPLLYVWPRFSRHPADALSTLGSMFASGSLRSGPVAWALTMALVAMAIWRDQLHMKYETWRLSHGLGAALIAGLSLHHALGIGSHTSAPALALYWQFSFTLAILTLVHIYIVRPLRRMRRPYRVASVEITAERTWLLLVEPCDGDAVSFEPISFEAGQFVWLNIGHSPFSLIEHPYSISSAPQARHLQFLIKESGDFTSRIASVKPGAQVWIDGPYGQFTLPDDIGGHKLQPLVFIVGGVGVAPVLSILRDLEKWSPKRAVSLIYGNRLSSQIVALDELRAMEARLGLSLHLVLGEPPENWNGLTGDLSERILSPLLTPLADGARYMICGPPPMIDSVELTLKRLGIGRRAIFTERFRY